MSRFIFSVIFSKQASASRCAEFWPSLRLASTQEALRRLGQPQLVRSGHQDCGVISRLSFDGHAAGDHTPSTWQSQESLQLGISIPLSLGISVPALPRDTHVRGHFIGVRPLGVRTAPKGHSTPFENG